MSNFGFLQNEYPDIFSEAAEAEKYTFNTPVYGALTCRRALERAVNWMFDNDAELIRPYDNNLSSLIHEQCFRNIIDPRIFQEINVIQSGHTCVQ
jgi:type I restriction enzyme R subunit